MFQFIRKVQRSLRLAAVFGNGPRRRRSLSTSDSLESRTLLASLVSATKISYQDADGDNVTVTLSKAVLTAGNVNSIFTFDVGTVDGSNTTKQQLRTINLTGVAGIAGTTITTAAVRSAANGGDGFAALGQINATGIDIGAVTIDGDLGRILAGDATTTTQGLGALKVHSMGRYGTLSGATNLDTVIQGKLASLTTKSDVKETFIDVQGGANGQIGSITIGGSLIGGTSVNTGRIQSSGDMGAISITRDLTTNTAYLLGQIRSSGKLASLTVGGSILNGSVQSTGDMGAVDVKGDIFGSFYYQGNIQSYSKMGTVTIGGSLRGGSGSFSGTIYSTGDMGIVKVTGDVSGIGSIATGPYSGAIVTGAKLAGVTIGGSLRGRDYASGYIFSSGDMGPISITGDLVGGTGSGVDNSDAGRIHSFGKLASVSIGGSIRGGGQSSNGSISSQLDMGPVVIKGSLIGGGGGGLITSNGKLASVNISGDLKGGTTIDSGQIQSALDMGAVTISGDVIGGAGSGTGSVVSLGKLASVTIGGSLTGGAGEVSGRVSSSLDMGAVTIGRDVIGGSSTGTGSVVSLGKLASVTIGGSLTGGAGELSGRIYSSLDIGAVKVTGNIEGGDGDFSGHIHTSRKLASLSVGGSIIGGAGGYLVPVVAVYAQIYAFTDIGPVTVTGSLVGGTGAEAGSIRSQSGSIGAVTIGGSLVGDNSAILSSLDMGAVKVTGDVQGSLSASGKMASVTIGGSLIGGVRQNSGLIYAAGEITTLTIGGNIRGGSASNSSDLEYTGYVGAGRIGTLTINGSLIAGTDNTSGLYRNNGAIRVRDDIANLTIKGGVIGNSTNKALITARGQLTPSGSTDLAIGKLTINGRVEYGLIVAGSSNAVQLTSSNADAQIGPVVIGVDWIASSLVAGAAPGVDGRYGTADDVKMSGGTVKDVSTVSSKITSIVIGGQVMGTPVLVNDHFGLVAENIGSFKVKGGTTTYSLTAGNSNDDILLSLVFGGLIGGDTRLNEI